jgi:RNA polymerase sigma-70 factor (ECF subfamily)
VVAPPQADQLLSGIEELYRQRYPLFLRFAQAMVGDRELARDAVQEAFALAVKGRFRFRHEGTLEAWIWRLLTNHCHDVVRRAARAQTQSPATLGVSNGRPDEHAHVRAAIAALPERQRLMLFLRHYADLDYEQIAQVTGVERGTVAATLHAGRAALRERMEEGAT